MQTQQQIEALHQSWLNRREEARHNAAPDSKKTPSRELIIESVGPDAWPDVTKVAGDIHAAWIRNDETELGRIIMNHMENYLAEYSREYL